MVWYNNGAFGDMVAFKDVVFGDCVWESYVWSVLLSEVSGRVADLLRELVSIVRFP